MQEQFKGAVSQLGAPQLNAKQATEIYFLQFCNLEV